MAVYTELIKRLEWKPNFLSDWVPWRMVAAPGVILNKYRHALQRSYLVRGPDLMGDSLETQGAKMLQSNNVLKRLGGQWMLQSEAQRGRLTAYPASAGEYPVAELIDADRRRVMVTTPGARETTYYLTLTWQPPAPLIRQSKRFFVHNLPHSAARDDEEEGVLLTFVTQADYFMELLQGVLAVCRPLTTEEMLTYLHTCVSDNWHGVRCPVSVLDIDVQLCDNPYMGGWFPQLGSWHLRTCSIRGYPATSTVGIIKDLESLDLDFRYCTRWMGMEKPKQGDLLRRTQGVWVKQEKHVMMQMSEDITGRAVRVIDSDATNKARQADAARQDLGADIVAYGDFTSTVTVWDEDPEQATAKLREAMQTFDAHGFITVHEKQHATAAWLSSIPGNKLDSVRKTPQHSLTVTHIMPGWSAAWPGPTRDNYLDGPAWFMAHTDRSTAFRVVQHVNTVGHTMVFGPTGAGKSVFVAFLVAQWFARPYGPRQVFWFDVGYSGRLLTLLLGGNWYELGKPGLAFQPLRNVDNQEARAIALQWLLDRVKDAEYPVTGDVQLYLSSTLKKLGDELPRNRTLSTLVTIMAAQSRELDLRARAGRIGADGISRPDTRLENLVATHHNVRTALLPFTKAGDYGWLFDADHDDLAQGPLHVFEQETLLKIKRLVKPVVSYVFQECEQRFSTDVKTWLPMDESVITAALEVYAEKYDEWLMVTRKKGVSLAFLINALHQIEGTALGRMLRDNCPTRYFLPNAEAMDEENAQVYADFGLNAQEVKMIATTRAAHDIYYSCRQLGKRLFHLRLSPFILDCLARNEAADHALMDELLAKEGREGFASAWFRYHGHEEAAAQCERRDNAIHQHLVTV